MIPTIIRSAVMVALACPALPSHAETQSTHSSIDEKAHAVEVTGGSEITRVELWSDAVVHVTHRPVALKDSPRPVSP
ncbi:MAG: hypothetical protein QM796_16745 [Chthoniobacteraceae bacterium]